jgi:hypothetical protein
MNSLRMCVRASVGGCVNASQARGSSRAIVFDVRRLDVAPLASNVDDDDKTSVNASDVDQWSSDPAGERECESERDCVLR